MIFAGAAIPHSHAVHWRGGSAKLPRSSAAVGNRELDRQPFIGRPHFRRQSKHHLGAKVSFQEIDCRRRVPTAAIDIDRIDRLLEALVAAFAVLIDLHIGHLIQRSQRGRVERFLTTLDAKSSQHNSLDVEPCKIADDRIVELVAIICGDGDAFDAQRQQRKRMRLHLRHHGQADLLR
jgi:hypothetical protein